MAARKRKAARDREMARRPRHDDAEAWLVEHDRKHRRAVDGRERLRGGVRARLIVEAEEARQRSALAREVEPKDVRSLRLALHAKTRELVGAQCERLFVRQFGAAWNPAWGFWARLDRRCEDEASEAKRRDIASHLEHVVARRGRARHLSGRTLLVLALDSMNVHPFKPSDGPRYLSDLELALVSILAGNWPRLRIAASRVRDGSIVNAVLAAETEAMQRARARWGRQLTPVPLADSWDLDVHENKSAVLSKHRIRRGKRQPPSRAK